MTEFKPLQKLIDSIPSFRRYFANPNSLYLMYEIGNDSSSVSISGQNMEDDPLPNEISAPYEFPQFPIEQIEKKLQVQRHLNVR